MLNSNRDEVLFENKWIQVVERDGWYTFTRNPWSESTGVAVLPYFLSPSGIRNSSFVGRYELTLCHSDIPELCSITGGYDKPGEGIVECALRELKEESGYETDYEALIDLGTLRTSKSSDNIMHLFGVDLSHPSTRAGEITGDGTKGEEDAYTKIVGWDDLVKCKDPVVHSMMLRLLSYLG